MANTTQPRNTQTKGTPEFRTVKCGAGQYYKGVPVMMGTDDNLVKPFTTASGTLGHGFGVSTETKLVTTHGVEDLKVATNAVFFFQNSDTTNELKNGDAGAVCYFADNQTVAKLSTGIRVVAGRLDHVMSGTTTSNPQPLGVGVFISPRGPRSGSV